MTCTTRTAFNAAVLVAKLVTDAFPGHWDATRGYGRVVSNAPSVCTQDSYTYNRASMVARQMFAWFRGELPSVHHAALDAISAELMRRIASEPRGVRAEAAAVEGAVAEDGVLPLPSRPEGVPDRAQPSPWAPPPRRAAACAEADMLLKLHTEDGADITREYILAKEAGTLDEFWAAREAEDPEVVRARRERVRAETEAREQEDRARREQCETERRARAQAAQARRAAARAAREERRARVREVRARRAATRLEQRQRQAALAAARREVREREAAVRAVAEYERSQAGDDLPPPYTDVAGAPQSRSTGVPPGVKSVRIGPGTSGVIGCNVTSVVGADVVIASHVGAASRVGAVVASDADTVEPRDGGSTLVVTTTVHADGTASYDVHKE